MLACKVSIATRRIGGKSDLINNGKVLRMVPTAEQCWFRIVSTQILDLNFSCFPVIYGILARMNLRKLLLLSVFASLIGVFFALGWHRYLDLESIQAGRTELLAFYAVHPLLTPCLFFVCYVLVTALSLPGAGIMTLLAGAIFSLPLGVALTSFASVIGACIAFWSARYLLYDVVQRRFGQQLVRFNAGVEREGGWYLLTVRMIPLFPFFVVNLVMGLTPIRLFTFAWVSQLGMLPLTCVIVLAGKQLSTLNALSDVFNLSLLATLAVVGLTPLACKKGLDWLRHQKRLQSVDDLS